MPSDRRRGGEGGEGGVVHTHTQTHTHTHTVGRGGMPPGEEGHGAPKVEGVHGGVSSVEIADRHPATPTREREPDFHKSEAQILIFIITLHHVKTVSHAPHMQHTRLHVDPSDV